MPLKSPDTTDLLLSNFLHLLESGVNADVFSPCDMYRIMERQCAAFLKDHDSGEAPFPDETLTKTRKALGLAMARLHELAEAPAMVERC